MIMVWILGLYIFLNWILRLNKQGSLEYVWIGYNSKYKEISLPEPDQEKVRKFMIKLKNSDIKLYGKNLRNIII